MIYPGAAKRNEIEFYDRMFFPEVDDMEAAHAAIIAHNLSVRARCGGDSRRAEPAAPSLGRDLVRATIGMHRQDIATCHQGLSDEDRSAVGRVVVRFTVLPAGAVSEASVQASSTHPSAAAASCIVEAVRTWRFPASGGATPTTVTWPFQLPVSPAAQ